MTFQPGNALARTHKHKARRFRQQLISVAQETDAQNVTKLRRMAERLMAIALDGDVAAIREVADRIDGKVPQQLQNDPDNPVHVIHAIERIIIDRANQRQAPYRNGESVPALIDARPL